MSIYEAYMSKEGMNITLKCTICKNGKNTVLKCEDLIKKYIVKVKRVHLHVFHTAKPLLSFSKYYEEGKTDDIKHNHQGAKNTERVKQWRFDSA